MFNHLMTRRFSDRKDRLDSIDVMTDEQLAREIDRVSTLLTNLTSLQEDRIAVRQRTRPDARENTRPATHTVSRLREPHHHPDYGHRTRPIGPDGLETTWKSLITHYVVSVLEGDFTKAGLTDAMEADGYWPKTSTITSQIKRMVDAGKLEVVSHELRGRMMGTAWTYRAATRCNQPV